MLTKELNKQKSEAFAEHMVEVLNNASIALMASIGHQTGLFDTMATLPPATSEEIAEVAGLNERYVREWLGAMVTGAIVEYDPEGCTYRLPAEHAASLTRTAGPQNIALECQYFAMMGEVEQKIVECFHNGGGVPYDGFHRFQHLMAQDSAAVFDNALLTKVIPLIPGLSDRLDAGIDVLDIGCGSGHAMNLLALEFPASRFAGYDMMEEGIDEARKEAARRGLHNVRFDVRDAAALHEPEAYDFITAFDAIHDQAHPDRVLKSIYEALRPGGTFLMVDIAASSNLEDNKANPFAPFLYTISCMHCMSVSLAYGGMGLGTVWGEQKAHQMLKDALFQDITVQRIDSDLLNMYFIAHKK